MYGAKFLIKLKVWVISIFRKKSQENETSKLSIHIIVNVRYVWPEKKKSGILSNLLS